MDSRSRRLPFCLSTSRSPYTSSPTPSSSSLGSNRLYSRDTGLNERFPRVSTTFKADVDQKSSRLLRSSRDYSNIDSHNSSWKMPTSVVAPTRPYEHLWTEFSISSRTKLADSDERLGRSSLLTSIDDGDSKRAKLAYSNRGLYSRATTTSLTGSTYNSNGHNNRATNKEKQSDPLESSWSSSCFLSRSSTSCSKPLLSSRDAETHNDPSLSGQRERRTRISELTSSLYQTDRVTSTYAQGARPKDTAYSSLSTGRESSPGHHVSSSTANRFSLARDLNNRPSSRVLTGSSSRPSSQEHADHSSSSSSSWYSTPPARPEVLLPLRPGLTGAEPQGRSSTRQLLSRLFSRSSSQDSSSSSSTLDDDSLSLESDEGSRMTAVESDSRRWQSNTSSSNHRRADLAPIRENKDCDMCAARMPSPGEPDEGSAAASGNYSWLSSSLRSRCPPLLCRLRRHARDKSASSPASLEEDLSRPQHLLRRWDDVELRASQDSNNYEEEEEEEYDDDEDEEEQGAVGLDFFGSACPRRQEEDKAPEVEDDSVGWSQLRRVPPFQNTSSTPQGGTERPLDGLTSPRTTTTSTITSSKQEKLRIIKERLLLEDSDEDEGDLCRICQMREESASNPLIQPCRCTGSLQYVHQECIKRWLCSKIGSGTDLEAITNCELCKDKLRLNIDNFDIQQLYRTHVQSEYDDFISSGLYLVVLLHFCEQRFSDVLGAVDAAGTPTPKVMMRVIMAALLSSSQTWTMTSMTIDDDDGG
uniref:E3 ubiquitin-protein ligase MARCH7 isoform X2 n=1 Tax=Doryrhamphus excisus TaxID=161450 RepID=UPI0025AEBB5A|nr:E3 ubiquitin-protein ligase MARCH7 isoform X2 [Doryrhamphus excisus]